MAEIEVFNPATVHKPLGAYSHVAEVGEHSKLVFIAGQVAMDADGNVVGVGDIEAQAAQAYANLANALEASGGDWKNVVQFMQFVTRREDLPKLSAWRRRELTPHYPENSFPPSTLLIVSGLADDKLLIEVQAVAAI